MGFRGSKTNTSSGSLYEEFRNGHVQDFNSTSGKVGKFAREDVVITSLFSGCGATYISAAIANYLVDVRRGRTVRVGDAKDEYITALLRSNIMQKTYPVEIQELYNICDCVVQDVGSYYSLDKTKSTALSRATTKIIVCHADDDSLKLLASFARERTDAERFFYIFNVLPDEWRRKVYKTMNIYEAYCLPLFNAKSPDKEVKKILKRIFGR